MVAPAAAAASGRAAAGARAASNAGRSAGATRAGRGGPARGRSGAAAGPVEAPTVTDDRELRRELHQRDAGYRAAYEAGLAGEALEGDVDEATRDAWAAGDLERRRQRRSAVVESVRGRAGIVDDGAGFVLGLLLYALALNYLQGGAAQARGWIRAKFLNQPYVRPTKVGGRVPK